jgi:hypothetical protein
LLIEGKKIINFELKPVGIYNMDICKNPENGNPAPSL